MGQGIEQNFSEAYKWYLLAAEQGNPEAQFSLGVMFQNGEGVPKNFETAIRWFLKASDNGNKDAKKALENINRRDSKISRAIPEPKQQQKPQPQQAPSKSQPPSTQLVSSPPVEQQPQVKPKNKSWIGISAIVSLVVLIGTGYYFSNRNSPSSTSQPGKSGFSTLLILTVPSEAQVSINNQSVGLTPLLAEDVPQETLSIAFIKEGYDTFSTTMEIKQGQNLATFRLKETPKPLTMAANSTMPEQNSNSNYQPSNPKETPLPAEAPPPIRPQGPSKEVVFVSGDKVNLRQTPEIVPNNKIALLPLNEQAIKIDQSKGSDGENWVKIQTSDGQAGWIRSDYLNPGKVKLGVLTELENNIRSGPGLNFDLTEKPKKGTKITLLEENGKWYKIRFGNGKVGWTHKMNIKITD